MLSPWSVHGDDKYKAHVVSKTAAEICSNINKNSTMLSSASRHATSVALIESASTKFDWIMQVLPPRFTLGSAQQIDKELRKTTATCWGPHTPDDSEFHTLDPYFTQTRAAQPVRNGGTGLRHLTDRAHSCFLGSINGAVPPLIDSKGEEEVVKRGTFPHLTNALGKGSFDKGKESTRFSYFLASNCTLAKDFRSAHTHCKDREDQLRAQADAAEHALLHSAEAREAAQEKREKELEKSAMQVPIEGFGYLPCGDEVKDGKMNRAISHTFHDLVEVDLRNRVSAMDKDDQRRIAFIATSHSPSARAIFSGGMEKSVKFTDKEWMEAVQTYLGTPSSLALDILGRRIETNNPNSRFFVEPYARTLHTAMGWTGDSRHLRAHMELEHLIASDVKAITDGSVDVEQEVFNELTSNVPAGPGRDRLLSLSQNQIKKMGDGLVPDLAITVSPDHGGSGERELMDIKFTGCGLNYTESVSASPQAVVNARQRRVNEEYRSQAHHLDRKYCGHAANAPGLGPIATALAQYPRVKGLVVGHFADFSTDLNDLLDTVVQASAAAYADSTGTPIKLATGAISWFIRRRWAMTAARANSRTKIAARAHVLGRTSLRTRRNRNREEFGCVLNRWDMVAAATAADTD